MLYQIVPTHLQAKQCILGKTVTPSQTIADNVKQNLEFYLFRLQIPTHNRLYFVQFIYKLKYKTIFSLFWREKWNNILILYIIKTSFSPLPTLTDNKVSS